MAEVTETFMRELCWRFRPHRWVVTAPHWSAPARIVAAINPCAGTVEPGVGDGRNKAQRVEGPHISECSMMVMQAVRDGRTGR